MTINNKKRILAFEALPDVYKALYSSERTTQILKTLVKKYEIEAVDIFIQDVGDTMLNFIPFSELRKKMLTDKVVSELQVDALLREIKNYIQPLLTYWNNTKEHGSEIVTSSQSADIDDTLQPLRTMEGDLRRVHGYGSFSELYKNEEDEPVHTSSQESIVQRPNLTNTPSYHDRSDE